LFPVEFVELFEAMTTTLFVVVFVLVALELVALTEVEFEGTTVLFDEEVLLVVVMLDEV
jgi:hypothetical protein